MATFPTDAICLLLDGYGESFDPSIERSEMERGVPKQRVINSRVMSEIAVRIMFESKAAASSFDGWYFNTIKRIGWFDFTHPRAGGTVEARFKGADIGTLVPLIPDFSCCYRDVTLEYLR